MEKRNKIASLEQVLVMPEVSREDIFSMNTEKSTIQKEIERLELKLKSSNSKSAQLKVFYDSASQAAQLKEQAYKLLDKAEKDAVLY